MPKMRGGIAQSELFYLDAGELGGDEMSELVRQDYA